jgi:hypothetical protein
MAELVARLTGLVRAERQSTADVIEHLVEVQRRRLYLSHRAGSLYGYCIKQLGHAQTPPGGQAGCPPSASAR